MGEPGVTPSAGPVDATGTGDAAAETSPADSPPAAPSSRRSTLGGASFAVVSQGVVAASSLVLQWLALRELGASGLGDFAILSNGLIVTAAALHTGWVGDSLVILDRHADGIRRAIWFVSGVSAVVSFVFGVVGAWVFTDLGRSSTLVFGAALTAWLIEETGRRLLMARLEFGKLVLNDVVFGLVSCGISIAVTVFDELTMTWLVGSMLAGALASIAVVVVQLPADELRPPSRGPMDLRTLASFSAWRSGQLTMRPLGMLLSRVAVATFVSTAALGIMEAGRLIIAPVLTAANGLGGFSLPFFTRKRDAGRLDLRVVTAFAAVSAAGAALFTPVAVLLTPAFERLSNSGDVPTTLVLAWCCYGAFYSANVPMVNALTALMHSRTVFWGRCVDSVVIVVLSAVVATTWGIEGVPLAMALGMVIGTAVPLVVLRRRGVLPPWRVSAAPVASPA